VVIAAGQSINCHFTDIYCPKGMGGRGAQQRLILQIKKAAFARGLENSGL
jgi:hypothetical protein